jgi:cytochrome bd ubiquinol oxidase subunit I
VVCKERVPDLLTARGQMTVSLAFHILFSVAGMAMPLLMLIADVLALRTRNPAYEDLAKRWAKGTAILFAVGAVSGTVLSFELGLLWPGFMVKAGPFVGLPFSLEGFAFFLEGICLGLYLYGRGKLAPKIHLFSAAGVAISGLTSGIFVMAVNAWMHTPLSAGGERIDPWVAFKSPSFPTQAAHMAIAAYTSIGFAVLGIHALGLLRRPTSRFHKRAAQIALGMCIVSAPLQILTGDFSAKHVAKHQPIKFAAAEALYQTEKPASIAIGGWPDTRERRLVGAIEIPYALGVLAHGDPFAEVTGLEAFPEEDWPNIPIVHLSFDLMVGLGFAMLALAAWGAFGWWRKKDALWSSRLFLKAAVIAAPFGLLALEAGWVVTEAGRQPWIIRGVMRTSEAVTPMPGLAATFVAITLLYAFLGIVVLVMLRAHVFKAEAETE